MRLNTYLIFMAYNVLQYTAEAGCMYIPATPALPVCPRSVCRAESGWNLIPFSLPPHHYYPDIADYEVHLLTLHGCRVPEPRRRPYFGCRKVLYRSVIEVDIKMYTFSIGCGIYWYCKCKRNSAQSQGDDTVIKYFIISALNQITCSVYPRHFGAEFRHSLWSAPFFCSLCCGFYL